MKENLLDILMYLFENHLDESGVMPDLSHLREQLDSIGFPNSEIEKAFTWMEGLNSALGDTQLESSPSTDSLRLFCAAERAKLDIECRGFLLFLEQTGILDPINRELIIDRVMALESIEIDLLQLKWVILMVLFNQPGQEAAYAWLEDLVFDEATVPLH